MSFSVHEPTTLGEALAVLKDEGDAAAPLAGGTDLLLRIRRRARKYRSVVNIKFVPGLNELHWDARTGLTIGALTTFRAIETHDSVRAHFPGARRGRARRGRRAAAQPRHDRRQPRQRVAVGRQRAAARRAQRHDRDRVGGGNAAAAGRTLPHRPRPHRPHARRDLHQHLGARAVSAQRQRLRAFQPALGDGHRHRQRGRVDHAGRRQAMHGVPHRARRRGARAASVGDGRGRARGRAPDAGPSSSRPASSPRRPRAPSRTSAARPTTAAPSSAS